MFCPNLQKHPKPIDDLTRKGKPFFWTKKHQDVFEEIMNRVLKPFILHLPDNIGRYQLFSDTSKTAAGAALYKIQNCTPKLSEYVSKRPPQ